MTPPTHFVSHCHCWSVHLSIHMYIHFRVQSIVDSKMSAHLAPLTHRQHVHVVFPRAPQTKICRLRLRIYRRGIATQLLLYSLRRRRDDHDQSLTYIRRAKASLDKNGSNKVFFPIHTHSNIRAEKKTQITRGDHDRKLPSVQ